MSLNAERYADRYAGTDAKTGDAGRPAAPAGPGDGTDGSAAAARLLEMTARETDLWRSEAKSEAAAILEGARADAAELVRAARVEAERLVKTAQEESARTTNDARVEAYRVREETTAVRRRHDEDVARLQQVASAHREQLRHQLTVMLEQVDATSEESAE